jgi:predicted nuclease of restriction endonuclease-like (RecB) superfamily
VGRAANRDIILLYWDIGRGIVEKQEGLGWGNSVVEMVARDLQRSFAASKSFSPDNLWRMRQLYLAYSAPEFLGQAVPEIRRTVRASKGATFLGQAVPEKAQAAGLSADATQSVILDLLAAVPWGQNLLILKKIDAPAARLYYLRATAQFGWTRSVLLNQIKAGTYERAVTEKKTHNFPAVLPEYLAEQAEETLKSSYCLEFLGIHREVKERELEDRLIERLKEFILELGYGFCFVGRQYRLALGQKEYFIDLLFYHRFLKALVAFELKVGPFEPEYAGKMDFYLNLLNDKERASDDNPSIGIILCAEKDDVEVEYALRTKQNPIGVAAYQLQSKLPGNLRGKLPTVKQLSEAVRAALPERSGK